MDKRYKNRKKISLSNQKNANSSTIFNINLNQRNKINLISF